MALTIDDFGRLLAKKRGIRGVRAAALDAGVTPATYSRVENGHMPDLQLSRVYASGSDVIRANS